MIKIAELKIKIKNEYKFNLIFSKIVLKLKLIKSLYLVNILYESIAIDVNIKNKNIKLQPFHANANKPIDNPAKMLHIDNFVMFFEEKLSNKNHIANNGNNI